MNITIFKMPDLSQYANFISQVKLSDDLTVICVFKQLYRSDNVILDLYTDDISDETKIVSSKVLCKDTLISLPKPENDFNFYINCVNLDSSTLPLNKNNLHKFYLQFTNQEDTEELEKEINKLL